jgi:hypothetical protein
MKTSLTLLATGLLLLMAFFAACSSDSTSPDPNNQPTALSEATIGTEGGVWEYEDFQLHVPPGLLPDGTTLSLFAADQDTAWAGGGAASTYGIEGIPAGLDRDFRLRLRHSSASGDSLYAMVGQPGFIPSLGRTITRWEMIAATDSSGWALFDLPVAGLFETAKNGTPRLKVTVKGGIANAESSQGRFKLHWQPDQINVLDIEAMAENLETSLDMYQFMGYQQTGFTAWPIEVQVKPIGYGGYWAPDPNKLGGHIAINPGMIQDPDVLAMLVGHEIFHLCQYFYDPRTVELRGREASPTAWLDEATAVHMEIYFAPNDEYPSWGRADRELALLDGLLTPAQGLNLTRHGYGLSSLIRYLYQHEAAADNFILDTYVGINGGAHAAAALQAATTTDISAEWQAILEDLVRGNIYADVTWPVIQASSPAGLLTVGGDADTTGTITRQLSDLSGLLATVDLDYDQWSTLHRLEFFTEPADCGVSLLGVNADGDRQLLVSGTGRVTHHDPAFLQAQYEQLLVLVSNPRFEEPTYDGARQVSLQGRVRTAQVQAIYPRLSFHLQCDVQWDDESSSVNQEINIWNVEGNWADGFFNASWDSTVDDGAVRFVGQISAAIHPELQSVTSWSVNTGIWHSDNTGYEYSASGTVVPMTNLNLLSFSAWLEDVATCSGVTSVNLTEVNNLGSRATTGFSCRNSSYVKFFFENPLPGGR